MEGLFNLAEEDKASRRKNFEQDKEDLDEEDYEELNEILDDI